MNTKNQLTLTGEIVNDLERNELKNGSLVVRFRFKSEQLNGFHSLAFAWGTLARFINNYCAKQSKLMLSGRWVKKSNLDADGNLKFSLEFEIKNLVLLR